MQQRSALETPVLSDSSSAAVPGACSLAQCTWASWAMWWVGGRLDDTCQQQIKLHLAAAAAQMWQTAD